MRDAAVQVSLLAPPNSRSTQADAQPSASQIAYTYTYTVELPPSRITALMKRHQQACADAGPQTCQLLDSNLTVNGGASNGTLNLRAAPVWLARFRAGIDNDAHDAGGRVSQSTVGAEDLTRSLVDKQAEVRAQTTLRDLCRSCWKLTPAAYRTC